MSVLLHTLGALLAATSGLYFLCVSSPRGAPLTLPKMFTSSGAAFCAGIGGLVVVLGLATAAPVAAALAATGTALSIRYLIRVAAPHEELERAFGPDWRSRIPAEQHARMLPHRWVGRLPAGPEPLCAYDLAFWKIPESGRELLCDLWQPAAGTPASGLAFLYFHGSGWHWLDKDFNTRRFFRHLSAQGHVAMDVAYRLCPEVDLVGMLGDVKRAIAWMKQNAASYEVDPQRVVTGGGSAGGHLALLAAYAPDHPALTPNDVKDADLSVRGVASWYGPVDLRAYDRHAGATLGPGPQRAKSVSATAPKADGITSRISDALMRRVMGSAYETLKQQEFPIAHSQMMANLLGGQPDEVPERYELGSPITHAGPGSPPTLLLQGAHDSIVPAAACRALYRKLVDAGVPVVHREYPQTEHAFDVAVLPRYSPAAQAALYELDRFLALV